VARLISYSAILGFALSFALASTLTPQQKQTCKVQMTSPQNGDAVGRQAEVRGTAALPPGMFLWVFAHREGLARWWPQGGGAARVKGKTGEWVVLATYGDDKDPPGAAFEIIAVIVDQKSHDEIVKYVQKSESENYYPGMELPPADPGCVSEEVVVKKK
jgi:hypothetical protein